MTMSEDLRAKYEHLYRPSRYVDLRATGAEGREVRFPEPGEPAREVTLELTETDHPLIGSPVRLSWPDGEVWLGQVTRVDEGGVVVEWHERQRAETNEG